ncbi:DUF4837 family protein [Prevotella sp. HUN102]|uniref:DUF4837 family protein n=1 Tax=Prevotella sp. HUN102 TaxID=1392486 RepID=UPI00048CF6CB|nr:DUF4837 family protein [Prevotella sp. HUN102]
MSGRKLLCLCSLFALFLLWGCKEDSLLPKGGGKPYEVLIVGDDDSLLFRLLSVGMTGLPQSEPCFDISEIDSLQFKGSYRLVRNIVVLKTDSLRYLKTEVSVARNVYAQPQMIITVAAPSEEALRTYLQTDGNALRTRLVKAELARVQQDLNRHRNPSAESKVREMFGVDMRIPSDMTSSKKGKDFLWFSNNASAGMANICIYTIRRGDFRQQRDSVMRRNIPGEHEGMFVQTTSIASVSENKGNSTTIRGLWEMKNDAMGGPFIAYAKADGATDRLVVAEAFVYAPETKKRNLLRRLEAVLYTMQRK